MAVNDDKGGVEEKKLKFRTLAEKLVELSEWSRLG